jgi:hydrogenase expression/formation protein HypC
MCLAVHGRISSVEGSGLGAVAVVHVGDAERTVSLAMTPEARVGDWVVFHSGYALRVIDAAEASAYFEAHRDGDAP